MFVFKPVAEKFVEAARFTTTPPPRALPAVYTVPSTGPDDKAAEVLLTTRYSSAPEAAVKLPAMEEEVMAPKLNTVGCADGVAQGGNKVVRLPDNGAFNRYFGPPLQDVLFME